MIGVRAELAIRRMRTRLPVRFAPAEGGVRIEGVVVDCSAETGRASGIELLRVLLSGRGQTSRPSRPTTSRFARRQTTSASHVVCMRKYST